MLLDKEIQISPGEYQIWKDHPTTQAVFQALFDERSRWVERLAFGETMQRPGLEVRDTAEAVGVVAGITITLEDLEVALQQQWAEAQARKEAEREETEND